MPLVTCDHPTDPQPVASHVIRFTVNQVDELIAVCPDCVPVARQVYPQARIHRLPAQTHEASPEEFTFSLIEEYGPINIPSLVLISPASHNYMHQMVRKLYADGQIDRRRHRTKQGRGFVYFVPGCETHKETHP